MNCTASSPLVCDLRTTPALTLTQLADQCSAQLASGARLITLFGRRLQPAQQQASAVGVTAILLVANGDGLALQVLRAQAQAQEHYTALSARFAAAQSHERELWEQTGLVPDGHPWLKPVRFEGALQQHMHDYPFFVVRGQEVHEVGVGPIHAGVIEPGHFRFMCLGEQVQHLEVQLGYQHRGVEALLLRRPPLALTPLVESVCGDSCVAYAWAYCTAVEALGKQPVSLERELSRGIALEMERIAMHLATLGGLAGDVAFLQGASTYGRLRTAIINATQRVCGNRFGRGWLRPGQAQPLDTVRRVDLIETLTRFRRDWVQVNDLLLHSASVTLRFKNTGHVSPTTAQELGLTGPVARASGVDTDLRRSLPGRLYGAYPIETHRMTDGDCWARMHQRMFEVSQSTQWLLGVLGNFSLDLQSHAAPTPTPAFALQPNALCVSVIEGTRGPVVHALETDDQGALLHYKIQDPSLSNWFGLALALRGNAISDFPICNKSFDLSYSGNDL